MKYIFITFSLLLLVYMIWPGPGQIANFPALPHSDKSTLEGDTIQIPDVAGYFSDNYRNFAVPFYIGNYQLLAGFPFGPIVINRPPEYAWTAIKKYTDSTYLEELVYPLRDSLFVNGFEPFDANGNPRFWGATQFVQNGDHWFTKVTLRFYPSNTAVRVLVWFGISLSALLLYNLSKKVIFNHV